MRTLAIMEDAHRGGVEKQFFTPFYLAIELHNQLGGLDLLLRGPAVTCALDHRRTVSPDLIDSARCATPDPRDEVRRLVDLGVGVAVESSSLVAVTGHDPGADASCGLLDGVTVAADGETATRWHEYRDVVFL